MTDPVPGRADAHGRARRPVCMLTHSYFEEDSRVRREAALLLAAGRPVDVFSLRRTGDQSRGEVDGVRVIRLDVQRHQGAGLPTYLAEYLAFFGRAALAAVREHRRRRYALVQVHTLPDFLVFAGLPFRMVGIPLVLDLHEAMPEFFRSRFPRASGRLTFASLVAQERLAIRASTVALTVNDALGERLVALGVPREKVVVIPNAPSLSLFDVDGVPARSFMADGTLRLVYAGALTPTYELGVTLEAVARLRELRPELPVHYDVFGRGDLEAPLRQQAGSLGILDRVTFHGRVPLEEMPGAIAARDIGLAPTRRDPFTDFSLSTKVFEYGAMDKPVIASRLPLVERLAAAGQVTTYDPGDPVALATAILALVDDPDRREEQVRQMRSVVQAHSWEQEGRRYVALIEELASGSRNGRGGGAEPRSRADVPTGGRDV